MKTEKRRRPARALLGCLLIGGGSTLALWWAAVRSAAQERVDLELIAAIHRYDAAGAATAIDRGANVNCGYYPDGRPSFWYQVRHALSREPDGHATPLSEAVTRPYHARAHELSDSLPVVRLLLDRGADPNTRFAGSPLIDWAAGHQDTEKVRALLDHHCRPDARSSALQSAVACGNTRMVVLLLDHGVVANQRYTDGHTLLQEAEGKKAIKIAATLRKHGATR